MNNTPKKIIFYDGECGFCNTTVQFVLNREKNKEIYFSALQSLFTKEFFATNHFPTPDLSTFYFYDNGRLYSKSKAGIRVAGYLKMPYPLMVVFLIIPRFIRDGVYNFIANRRMKLSKGYCLMLSNEDSKRFFV